MDFFSSPELSFIFTNGENDAQVCNNMVVLISWEWRKNGYLENYV